MIRSTSVPELRLRFSRKSQRQLVRSFPSCHIRCELPRLRAGFSRRLPKLSQPLPNAHTPPLKLCHIIIILYIYIIWEKRGVGEWWRRRWNSGTCHKRSEMRENDRAKKKKKAREHPQPHTPLLLCHIVQLSRLPMTCAIIYSGTGFGDWNMVGRIEGRLP